MDTALAWRCVMQMNSCEVFFFCQPKPLSCQSFSCIQKMFALRSVLERISSTLTLSVPLSVSESAGANCVIHVNRRTQTIAASTDTHTHTLHSACHISSGHNPYAFAEHRPRQYHMKHHPYIYTTSKTGCDLCAQSKQTTATFASAGKHTHAPRKSVHRVHLFALV